MTLLDIFKGIQLLDEKPDDIWNALVEVYGHQFFLPTIDRLYSHILNMDPKKLEKEILKILEISKKNETALKFQCDI